MKQPKSPNACNLPGTVWQAPSNCYMFSAQQIPSWSLTAALEWPFQVSSQNCHSATGNSLVLSAALGFSWSRGHLDCARSGFFEGLLLTEHPIVFLQANLSHKFTDVSLKFQTQSRLCERTQLLDWFIYLHHIRQNRNVSSSHKVFLASLRTQASSWNSDIVQIPLPSLWFCGIKTHPCHWQLPYYLQMAVPGFLGY